MEMRDTGKLDDSLIQADSIVEDDSELTMVMSDGLIPALPTVLIIDVVSRLSGKDACKLKVLSKEWLSFISYDSEFRKLHRLRARQRPSLLVLSKVISDYTSPCLFVEDPITPLPPPMTGEVEYFGDRKLVFSFRYMFEYIREVVSSCRDLMCFYNDHVIYVYSPSTNQYLRFETCRPPSPINFRLAIVYVASMNLYKIVKLEVNPSPLCRANVRFYALTVEDEEDEPQCGRGRRCDVDEYHISEWQLISEHAIPSIVQGFGGNLIGVGGVVYVIVRFSDHPGKRRVLSLGFEENNKHNHNFKMFSLPQVGCDVRKCVSCYSTKHLSEVKDLLCYPHTNTSSIDLWLLKDRYTCTWFKGYTIRYMPSRDYIPGPLAYFPYPTTTVFDDDAIDDADTGAGLFLFSFEDKLYQYDIRTEESRLLLQEKDVPKLHVFSDNLYSLKNGLSCNGMPHPTPSYIRNHKFLPIPKPKPKPTPLWLRRMHLRRRGFNLRPPILYPSSLPLRLRIFLQLPQQSSLAERTQISLPPPPPTYFYHKVQHTVLQINPLPPLLKGLPPPLPFNDPHDFQDSIVKRRKSTR